MLMTSLFETKNLPKSLLVSKSEENSQQRSEGGCKTVHWTESKMNSALKESIFQEYMLFLYFQAFFDRYPQILSDFDKFNAIEIDGVLVSSALRMHTSRVLAVVEDMVDNTGNPEKIRNILQDLGRHHYKQVL